MFGDPVDEDQSLRGPSGDRGLIRLAWKVGLLGVLLLVLLLQVLQQQ